MNSDSKTPSFTKDSILHLSKLALLKLSTKEMDKFAKDLESIMNHFKELDSLDVSKVPLMIGGNDIKNSLRDDSRDIDETHDSINDAGRVVEAFPEIEKGYLKVPKILWNSKILRSKNFTKA